MTSASRSARHCAHSRAAIRRAIAPAIARLDKLVENTPLETLEPGERANARQRALAARQVPLWLVARACSLQKDEKLQKLAPPLGERALEAARRQIDNTFYLAMMRERGELALARGDKNAAAAEWGKMLEIVVTPARGKSKKPAAAPAVAPATAPAGKTKASSDGAATRRDDPGSRRRAIVRFASFQAQAAAGSASPPARGRAQHQRGCAGAAATGQRTIQLADLDPRPLRASHADRAAGRRA